MCPARVNREWQFRRFHETRIGANVERENAREIPRSARFALRLGSAAFAVGAWRAAFRRMVLFLSGGSRSGRKRRRGILAPQHRVRPVARVRRVPEW